ncbi:uncharacterized protein C6orf118-like [Narcine bancroftii]|uniref:uncharacterized protein C6orf118-like n=1 Tax=Narcine bancroftii TaxID=1343680 RepID=UPI003831A4ED
MKSMKCSHPHKKTFWQLLHGLEQAQKADILAYSFGHLNYKNLYKVSGQHEASVSWQSAKKPAHVKEKNPLIQQSKIKVKKMTNATVDLSLMTSVLPILPANNLPSLKNFDQSLATASKDIPDMTCSVAPNAEERTLQGHFIKEELDLTALMLVKPQLHKCAASHSSHDRSQFVESYLAGVTKKDQFRKRLEFEKTILMKQDLLERDIMSGYKAVVKQERKLAQELMKLGHLPVPNLKRLQIFNDVFEDICRDSTIFHEILKEIKFEYNMYLASLLESQPKNQHKTFQALFQIMENRPVKTLHVEDAHQRVLNLEQEANLALQRNYKLRNELEGELSKPKKQDVRHILKPIKTKDHQLSVMENVMSLRSRIYQTTVQIQELESELKHSMVPSTVTDAMQSSLIESQADIVKLQQSNTFLRKKITILERDIEKTLNEHKVTKSIKESFWVMVKDLVDPAENKSAAISG